VVTAVVLARAAGVTDNEVIGTFGVIFTSIVVEALPFILIGAAASAAIAVFVPPARAHHERDHRSAGAFVEHLASDFLFMGRFLVLGAAVAALLQTAVPQDWLSFVADQQLIGALALMGMAIALSLCSEADAFVAVSFTAFPLGSQLAFLVLGPVVDAKLAVLYGATFRRRFTLRLLAVAAPIALAGALVFDAVV